MIHVLNNLNSDYILQMLLLEKRIGNKSNLLKVDGPCEELNLHYKRLCNQSESNNESKTNEEQCFVCASIYREMLQLW
jgi:hypothetical protein